MLRLLFLQIKNDLWTLGIVQERVQLHGQTNKNMQIHLLIDDIGKTVILFLSGVHPGSQKLCTDEYSKIFSVTRSLSFLL